MVIMNLKDGFFPAAAKPDFT